MQSVAPVPSRHSEKPHHWLPHSSILQLLLKSTPSLQDHRTLIEPIEPNLLTLLFPFLGSVEEEILVLNQPLSWIDYLRSVEKHMLKDMLELFLIIGLVLSLSILALQDPYIGFVGISMVLIANLAFTTPLYKDRYRTRSPTLFFLIFLIAYYPVSKNTAGSLEILGIGMNTVLEFYFLFMLIGWLFNFSVPQQVKRPDSIEALISVLDNFTKMAYRILVGLLFIRWARLVPISLKNLEITLGILASLGILFALYFDLIADRGTLLRLGDTSLGSLAHLMNVAVFQFAILGFIYWLGRIQLLFWKYYLLTILILSVIATYARLQGFSLLHPRIGQVFGISPKQLDPIIKTDSQQFEKLITGKGFELPEGPLKELGIPEKALVVPLGERISDQALAISLTDPSNISILPPGSLDQIIPRFFGKTNISFKDLPTPSSQAIAVVSEHLPQIKQGLSQLSSSLGQYKSKLVEKLTKRPFIEIQEMDGYSRVSIPGIVDVIETPKGEIVKTFGLKIADAGKKTIIDGWLRIVEMEDWQYVNVLGIIKVLEHKTLKYSEVRLPGLRFREGVPPNPFENLEQEILEKLSLFWSNAFMQLIPEFQPRILSLKDGEVKALPLSTERSLSLPSDPFKAFNNLLVAQTEQIDDHLPQDQLLQQENEPILEDDGTKVEGKKIIRPDYEVLGDDNP